MTDEHRDAAGKERRGSMKEALGKVIGNDRVEAEGAAEKAAGMAERRTQDRQKTPESGPKGA